MSLWTSITKGVKSAASFLVKSPVAKFIPGLGTAATVASVAGAVGGLGKVAVKGGKAAARVIPGKGVVGKVATVGIATTAYQAGKPSTPVYDEMGNLVGYKQKRRRMNYGNMKAARRAGRRVAGTIRMLKKLEKSLPHKTIHRRS